MSVLAVVAHPDDELLGLGATLARHVDDGRLVDIVICAEGMRARDPAAMDQAIEDLRNCAREAAQVIGTNEPIFLGFPDNQMDQVALLDVVKRIESVVDEKKPNTIYTHHRGDLNVDHQVVSRAVTTATRPLVGSLVREVFAFETLSSTEWNFGAPALSFSPNHFVDVTRTFDRKLSALACYRSEVRDFPHPRSGVSLRALAQVRGATVGFELAEAFAVHRQLCP